MTKSNLRVLGAELAERLLPANFRETLGTLFAAAAGNLLLLQIATEAADVLALPLELICLPIHPGAAQIDFPVRLGALEIARQLRPADCTPPDVTAHSLRVLGFTASPVEDLGGYSLGDSELFWEREQERLLIAFDGLVGQNRGWLDLPDTGAVGELQRCLKQKVRAALLHISCHGVRRETTLRCSAARGALEMNQNPCSGELLK